MASSPVQPLRIHKGGTPVSPAGSPLKTDALPRPLSDISPTEKRRNSPSFKQATKRMILKDEFAPVHSSPFNVENNPSPRLFWQGRDTAVPNRFLTSENTIFAPPARRSSPSPTRKASMERLQRASRVKNSNMFAREQKKDIEPGEVQTIERPLANLKGIAYPGAALQTLRSKSGSPQIKQDKNGNKDQKDDSFELTLADLSLSPCTLKHARTPSRDQISPTKSALSQRFFALKVDMDSEDEPTDELELPEGRTLRGHVKSVTFDAAPPQVNEYEMTTPDLSSIGTNSRENSFDSEEEYEDEDGYYYDREDSGEHEDSFDESLEDIEKTPVVGPEDWRCATPDNQIDDSLLGSGSSPSPGIVAVSSPRPASRVESDSDSRPLPPLPGFLVTDSRRNSSGQLGAAERAITSQRGLPQPPVPASASKSEIQALSLSNMTLEERLQLMMIEDRPKTAAEEQRERRMRRAVPKTLSSTPESEIKAVTDQQDITGREDEDTLGDLEDYQLPPRPTRESILRKVSDQDSDNNTFSDSPVSTSSLHLFQLAHLDPDIPIPSTEEEPSLINDCDIKNIHNDELITSKEEESNEQRLCSPMQHHRGSSQDELDVLATTIQTDLPVITTSESRYSSHSDSTPTNQTPEPSNSHSGDEDNNPPTPRATSPIHRADSLNPPQDVTKSVSLPDFGGFMDKLDFGLGLEDYMSIPPSHVLSARATTLEPQALRTTKRIVTPQAIESKSTQHVRETPRPNYDGSDWGPGENDEDDGYESSDSVIRRPQTSESPAYEAPVIPDHEATIKDASGSKLKTRPSSTPADLMAMREARRQVSGETHTIPPIPERHRSRPPTAEVVEDEDLETGYYSEDDVSQRKVSLKRSLTLDLDMDVGLCLDQDFDRVIDKQKRGYILRKNTKLVVASSDSDLSYRISQSGSKSVGNSPTKAERPQSWVVEPWNGRRKSFRVDSKGLRKRDCGAVPPLPGQESNSRGLEPLREGVVSDDSEPVAETSEERGRLFVKVIGVKDLNLPLSKSEKSWFNLTLDNGVHCVATAWLELSKNAPIGQEFELVVPQELEFQLTLGVKLERPLPKRTIESPTKSVKTQKSSTFSRVFTSPKKRRLMEQALREEEQREVERQRMEAAEARARSQPSTWDLLSPLVAENGSFGRSYVCLKDHEAHCYGRPYVVDVAAFNEWAAEDENTISSVKSKRGANYIPRRAPYKVGKLELQLLFVPKPKGAKDDDMPKSMNSCIRQMKEAELASARSFEGHLSQQGGDCPYWRRRFFRLSGTKLTAYHETTGQPRATINLANASKLIDDRRTLTQPTSSTKSGGRRKSGFAEDEDGYVFIEEGFRIRFANGEVIDFYADSREAKESWMKVLDQALCKADGLDGKTGKWCEMVLKREENAMRMKQGRKSSGAGRGLHSRTKSMVI